VVRYHCDYAEDQLRQRMYEKALDAVATSPYAASVEGWVLAGWSHRPVHDAFQPGICSGTSTAL
jgi:hypothetical protein